MSGRGAGPLPAPGACTRGASSPCRSQAGPSALCWLGQLHDPRAVTTTAAAPLTGRDRARRCGSVLDVGARADGSGFTVGVTEPGCRTVRAHLTGCLDAGTAQLLTSALGPLGGQPRLEHVVLDLSALSFVDRVGMSVLGLNVLLLRAGGAAVTSGVPHGAQLHLLDCAAWAGWAPPQLDCTDILHWKLRRGDEADGQGRCPRGDGDA